MAITHAELVKNLCKDSDQIMDDLNSFDCHNIHMIMGVAGEVGELLDAIKKSVIYRKELDMQHVIEEMGDIEFYLEGLRQGLELTREEILAANIEKLQKRYESGKFSNQEANARADKVTEVEITPPYHKPLEPTNRVVMIMAGQFEGEKAYVVDETETKVTVKPMNRVGIEIELQQSEVSYL